MGQTARICCPAGHRYPSLYLARQRRCPACVAARREADLAGTLARRASLTLTAADARVTAEADGHVAHPTIARALRESEWDFWRWVMEG